MRRKICLALIAGMLASSAADAQTLEMLVAQALGQHPAIRSQQYEGAAAQSRVDAAKWQFWPTPVLSHERASAGGNDSSYNGGNHVTTLGVRQPLWTGGRLTANLERAEAGAELAQAGLSSVREQLALRVVQAWSEVVAANATLAAYERSRLVHERLLDMVTRRQKTGLSSSADVDLARSRMEGLLADMSSAGTRRDLALLRLQSLVGHTVDVNTFQIEAVSPKLASSDEELVRAAEEISPQLKRAQAQAKMAQRDINAAKSALSPDVYVRLERQYGSYSNRSTGDQNRIFIGVSSSFGAGLSTASAINGATASYQAALSAIDEQKLAIQEQVLQDVQLIRASASRRVALEASRATAGQVSQSWERQFLAGMKQWQDLMNAAREQVQTDVQLAEILGTEQMAHGRLRLYTGGVEALLK